jgi:hypothetical protein
MKVIFDTGACFFMNSGFPKNAANEGTRAPNSQFSPGGEDFSFCPNLSLGRKNHAVWNEFSGGIHASFFRPAQEDRLRSLADEH